MSGEPEVGPGVGPGASAANGATDPSAATASGSPGANGRSGASARTARVIVASNRAAAGVYDDTTGPLIETWFRERGWQAQVEVVPDGEPVGAALRAAVASGATAIVTTGGTGVSPTDRTPEETRAVLDVEIPGVAEEIRRVGRAHTPLAVLSRGLAGVAGGSVVVNLPGSTGGVRDGLGVLEGLLEHLVDQIRGGDHVRND
ncbi:MogA/MoaB family molybdenum cofactor biosynthesis protein [Herbiconiux liukaitaii]|uniref:MogA/MoaB family molybdenum cofactor biosynthesis protein n=1 Tax=Herbiconiux liukaitaii TaxID=3342799 RepID=UPI0035BB0828